MGGYSRIWSLLVVSMRSAVLPVAATVVCSAGCNAIFGIETLEPLPSGGGGATSSSSGVTSSSSSSGAAGGGGSAGATASTSGGGTGGAGGTFCTIGDERPCYTGPAGTEGVGECAPGTETCGDAGWGDCQGEVLPNDEVCDNNVDENCNGRAPDCFAGDLDVVARYFFDEATSGTQPSQALDATPNPDNLTLNYDGMSYVSTAGSTGLEFATLESTSYARDNTPTKHRSTLGGASALTVEMVLRLNGTATTGVGSPLYFLDSGPGTGSLDFALIATGLGQLGLFFEDSVAAATWSSLTLSSRTVVHLVVDTSLASATDRARLFVDGNLATVDAPPTLVQSATIGVATADLDIGGFDGATSLQGTIYYAAIYAAALTPTEISHNVTLLQASDDSP
jgi:hypothetical protein